MTNRAALERVEEYYTARLAAHGPQPGGVDWNSTESQVLRFVQLLRLLPPGAGVSLVDYGCGYGGLADHLVAQGVSFRYQGYDISRAMIDEACKLHAHLPNCRFTSDRSALETADYALASGVFNVRLTTPEEEWAGYVLQTLGELDELGRQGFAFNVLTRYADAGRMRPDLYYADPCALFDYCKRRFSRNVALLHDYDLYEFTVLVRKRPGE
jgi:hypothetical protein